MRRKENNAIERHKEIAWFWMILSYNTNEQFKLFEGNDEAAWPVMVKILKCKYCDNKNTLEIDGFRCPVCFSLNICRINKERQNGKKVRENDDFGVWQQWLSMFLRASILALSETCYVLTGKTIFFKFYYHYYCT